MLDCGEEAASDPYSCEIDANLDPVACYCGNSGDTPHPVAGRQANALGLFDMHGNVWEWVWDYYDVYPTGPVSDPLGAATGSGRLIRGGGYNWMVALNRSAYRNYGNPSFTSGDRGFRVVRTLP